MTNTSLGISEWVDEYVDAFIEGCQELFPTVRVNRDELTTAMIDGSQRYSVATLAAATWHCIWAHQDDAGITDFTPVLIAELCAYADHVRGAPAMSFIDFQNIVDDAYLASVEQAILFEQYLEYWTTRNGVSAHQRIRATQHLRRWHDLMRTRGAVEWLIDVGSDSAWLEHRDARCKFMKDESD